jgi:NADP-dependent 3-hydroxy acid dehydrogenase YdfG
MKTLEGKVTLVTGAGRGLGEAICRELANNGAVVIAADIRKDLLDQVVKDIKAQGKQAVAYEIDLTQDKQIHELFSQIQKDFGRLDFLINDAAIDKTVSIEELSIEDWDCIVDVNLRAPFITSKFAFSMMRQQGGGHIINICSTASKRAWPNASGYHATKWGLLGLSYALHSEGRPLHIKVTALISGGMRTPFLLDRFPDIDLENLQDPKNVAETVAFILTQPDETVIPEIMVLPMQETSWP